MDHVSYYYRTVWDEARRDFPYSTNSFRISSTDIVPMRNHSLLKSCPWRFYDYSPAVLTLSHPPQAEDHDLRGLLRGGDRHGRLAFAPSDGQRVRRGARQWHDRRHRAGLCRVGGVADFDQ